mmetsp:Transcript_33441/g.54423  ORF Transcript_33441/g.54423 Transcript_33441/m.54423 type:complete len:399 (-) Transcript_33441:33-1229(-)
MIFETFNNFVFQIFIEPLNRRNLNIALLIESVLVWTKQRRHIRMYFKPIFFIHGLTLRYRQVSQCASHTHNHIESFWNLSVRESSTLQIHGNNVIQTVGTNHIIHVMLEIIRKQRFITDSSAVRNLIAFLVSNLVVFHHVFWRIKRIDVSQHALDLFIDNGGPFSAKHRHTLLILVGAFHSRQRQRRLIAVTHVMIPHVIGHGFDAIMSEYCTRRIILAVKLLVEEHVHFINQQNTGATRISAGTLVSLLFIIVWLEHECTYLVTNIAALINHILRQLVERAIHNVRLYAQRIKQLLIVLIITHTQILAVARTIDIESHQSKHRRRHRQRQRFSFASTNLDQIWHQSLLVSTKLCVSKRKKFGHCFHSLLHCISVRAVIVTNTQNPHYGNHLRIVWLS